jgi:hypothetical protein
MKKRVIEVDDGLIVRDEFGSGYTAEDKTALPKSMIDEFVPEVYSLAELQGEQKEEILPAFPQEDKEDQIPDFPSDNKPDTVIIDPLNKVENAETPAITTPAETVKQPETIITVVDDTPAKAPAKEPSAEEKPVESKPEETKPAEQETSKEEPEKQVTPEKKEPDSPKDVKEKKHAKEKKAKKEIEEFEDPDIPSDSEEEG